MAKFKAPRHGDIFHLRFKDIFIFGRVLFSIEGQYDKIVPRHKDRFENWMDTALKKTFLIEIYDGVFDSPALPARRKILIPRAWAVLDGSEEIGFEVIGQEPVDPEKIEFPEILSVIGEGGKNFYVLERGELRYPLPGFKQKGEDYAMDAIGMVLLPYICLNVMGKSAMIDDDEDYLRDLTLEKADLLFNPTLRQKIYDLIQVDPDAGYYTIAREQGKDPARFY